MRVTRGSDQQHAVPEKRPTEAVIEFVTDDTAAPGNVLVPLAALLLSLAAKEGRAGAEAGDQSGTPSGHVCQDGIMSANTPLPSQKSCEAKRGQKKGGQGGSTR